MQKYHLGIKISKHTKIAQAIRGTAMNRQLCRILYISASTIQEEEAPLWPSNQPSITCLTVSRNVMLKPSFASDLYFQLFASFSHVIAVLISYILNVILSQGRVRRRETDMYGPAECLAGTANDPHLAHPGPPNTRICCSQDGMHLPLTNIPGACVLQWYLTLHI